MFNGVILSHVIGVYLRVIKLHFIIIVDYAVSCFTNTHDISLLPINIEAVIFWNASLSGITEPHIIFHSGISDILAYNVNVLIDQVQV